MNFARQLLVLVGFCGVSHLISGSAIAENWPAWRGADGTGISRETGLPVKWSATENIRWKVPLAEPCNSTPIVWDDRVFLTQGLDKGKRRALIALDRKTGKTLWQQEVTCDVEETSHGQNPPCSASPVTDGKAVFANFASGGILACSLDGKRLWHRDLGPVLSRWGNGGSPVLHGNLVIVFHGPGTPSILYGLDRETGKTVWTSEETPINSPVFGSWSTPVVVRAGDHDELVMPLPGEKIGGLGFFKGYDPANGKSLWQIDGLGNEVYAMPILGAGGRVIVGVSGHNGPTVAIRAGGSGNVTGSHRLWRTETKNPQRVSSGVIHDGLLFLADATGVLQCLKAETGESVFQERLGGNLWGSILLADGKLYVSNLEGDTYVVRAAPKFELLATNSVGEATYAALAPAHGELFLRTHGHLYCIANDAVAFEPVKDFPKLSADQVLGPCSAVATNSKGEIVLFHRGKHPILCVDADGKLLRSWGDDLIGKAHGLRVDRQDNVWITDIGNHRVMKFDPSGKLLLSLGTGKAGTGTDEFDRPTDIAFGANGDVFVSDGYGNSRVVNFSAAGRFLKSWGTRGKELGQFDLPHAIIMDSKGRLLVGDRENERIQLFDAEGKALGQWPGFAPYGLAINGEGQVFVADAAVHQVLRLDAEGKVVQRFGQKGQASGEFDLPHMLTFDSAGNLFVAEVEGKRFQKFKKK